MHAQRLAASYWEELTESVGKGWNAFWFSQRSSQQLAAVRIATGVIALLYFASFASDFNRWLGPKSLLPAESVGRLLQDDTEANYHYSLLTLAKKPAELMFLQGVAFVGAICLTMGLFSRTAAIITLVMLLSYVHRVPMVSGFSEPVLAMLLFYLCFVPGGEWFSVDALMRRRKSGAEPGPSVMGNLGTRLIQVHLAAFVFMMGMSKLSAEPWWQGDALWYLIAQTRSRPVDLSGLRSSPFIINAWTHAVVAFEFAFPILVWNRFARPILLVLGPLLWLSLALVSGNLLFALAMTAASLAFWSWEETPARSLAG